MIKTDNNAEYGPHEQQPRGRAPMLIRPVAEPRASQDSDDECHPKVQVRTHRLQAFHHP